MALGHFRMISETKSIRINIFSLPIEPKFATPKRVCVLVGTIGIDSITVTYSNTEHKNHMSIFRDKGHGKMIKIKTPTFIRQHNAILVLILHLLQQLCGVILQFWFLLGMPTPRVI